MADNKRLKLTLIRSMYGRKPGHQQCVRGLGLRRRHDVAVVEDTPENRGMINKVSYMLQIEDA